MSYIEQEQGVLTGKPIELYEFIYPDKTYRYSTSISPYTALGEEWTPIAITRGNIKVSNRKGSLPLKITAPKDFLPATNFKSNSRNRIPVVLYRTHIGDEEIFLQGKWFVSEVSFTNVNSIIQISTVAVLLQTELPRYFYQFQCNHELYGAECGVAPSFVSGTILVIDSGDTRNIRLSVTIPADALLGVITVGTEHRLIRQADGTQDIVILEPFINASVNDSFSAHDKGCDRSYTTCVAKFSNGVKFGGMPFIPKRNIFTGGF